MKSVELEVKYFPPYSFLKVSFACELRFEAALDCNPLVPPIKALRIFPRYSVVGPITPLNADPIILPSGFQSVLGSWNSGRFIFWRANRRSSTKSLRVSISLSIPSVKTFLKPSRRLVFFPFSDLVSIPINSLILFTKLSPSAPPLSRSALTGNPKTVLKPASKDAIFFIKGFHHLSMVVAKNKNSRVFSWPPDSWWILRAFGKACCYFWRDSIRVSDIPSVEPRIHWPAWQN